MTTQSIPAESTLLVAPEVTVELLPADTCDKCGPAVTANIAVLLLSGGLLTFCNHCYNQFAASLAALIRATSQNKVVR
jgi:hypothetical protein